MSNARKKLTLLAVFMFAASIALNIFLPRETRNKSAEAGNADEAAAAASQEDNTGIFGGYAPHFTAHRGYSAVAPENTALAFELAGKSGFWGIETDISETYDGEFVCMHDDTIDRTTDGSGYVSEYTYASLQELSIISGENVEKYPDLKIPTMAEYLSICSQYGSVAVVEIKKISNYDGFLQLIYDAGMGEKSIITGNIEDLKEIRARNADIPLMVIGYSNKDYTFYTELISELDGGNKGILYNYPVVTKEVVDILHESGLLCGVWSLDTAEEAQTYIDYGADYIVTNEIPASINLMVNTTE